MRRVHNKKTSGDKSGHNGAVLVEMAFMLPLLALIFLCIIDLGLVIREYQVLQNAAREAARFSAQPKNQIAMAPNPAAKLTEIQQFAATYAAQENVSINLGDITVNQTFAIPGNCGSEITITYARSFFVLGVPILPTGSVTLTGRSVFYNLYGC